MNLVVLVVARLCLCNVCNSKRNNNVEKIVASEKRVVQSPQFHYPHFTDYYSNDPTS